MRVSVTGAVKSDHLLNEIFACLGYAGKYLFVNFKRGAEVGGLGNNNSQLRVLASSYKAMECKAVQSLCLEVALTNVEWR